MRLKLPTSEQFLFATNLLCELMFFQKKSTPDFSKILVVKWDEIGDMATATHVFELLRKQYPYAVIDVLCKPFVKGLIINDPNINTIYTDINDWNMRYPVVVELRGTWKTLFKAIRFNPFMRTSRARVRWRNRGKQLHEYQTNFECLKGLLSTSAVNIQPRLYFSAEDKIIVDNYCKKESINSIAIFHAGARKKLRQWNPERFALVAQYAHEKYGLDIVFIGSEDEREVVSSIQAQIPFKTFDATGVFSLSQLSYLCSIAKFYIGNESGPMHIASAFNLPLIALFGPGVPDVFYPKSTNAVVLHHVLECNPCDQIHCVQPTNPCISRIQSSDVLLKMDEILHL